MFGGKPFGGSYWAQGGGVSVLTPCFGQVFGSDFASAHVVGEENIVVLVAGGDFASMHVAGRENAPQVTGMTAPRVTVSGGDRRREGC